MGHVIEFGHSLVLERLGPASYPRWWCGVDSGTSSGLRAVEVYEPYKVAAEGQSEGSFTGVRTMWRKMWWGEGGGEGETENVTYRCRQITLRTREHSGG